MAACWAPSDWSTTSAAGPARRRVRADPAGAGLGLRAGVASQTAALLDEERRLFYVAATRARRRLIVTAVHSGDGEEQPSRFLGELRAGR